MGKYKWPGEPSPLNTLLLKLQLNRPNRPNRTVALFGEDHFDFVWLFAVFTIIIIAVEEDDGFRVLFDLAAFTEVKSIGRLSCLASMPRLSWERAITLTFKSRASFLRHRLITAIEMYHL
jgi:hypothetical protein